MCNCEKNTIDSQHLKIYTIMAEYKAKSSTGTIYKGDIKIKLSLATQEELAYIYEDLGLTSLVEKLSTTTKKDEPKKTSKKKSSKNKD
jgi:hypothetical protein